MRWYHGGTKQDSLISWSFGHGQSEWRLLVPKSWAYRYIRKPVPQEPQMFPIGDCGDVGWNNQFQLFYIVIATTSWTSTPGCVLLHIRHVKFETKPQKIDLQTLKCLFRSPSSRLRESVKLGDLEGEDPSWRSRRINELHLELHHPCDQKKPLEVNQAFLLWDFSEETHPKNLGRKRIDFTPWLPRVPFGASGVPGVTQRFVQKWCPPQKIQTAAQLEGEWEIYEY